MTNIVLLWRLKGRVFAHLVGSLRTESRLKISVVSTFAVCFWVGMFCLFYYGFDWLLTEFDTGVTGESRSIGEILMVRMLSVLFLVMLLMLTFSNVLIAFSTFFKSRETTFLFTMPLSALEVYTSRFVECLAFSSWAFLFLGSPLMTAYGFANHAPLRYYLATALFFFPFIVIPGAIGATMAILMAHIFPRLKMRTLMGLGVMAGLGFVLYLRPHMNEARLANVETFVPQLLSYMKGTQSSLLPSYWASQGILEAAFGGIAESAFYFLLLTSNALVIFGISQFIAAKLYAKAWNGVRSSFEIRLKEPGKGILNRLSPILGVFLPQPVHGLVMKDIKTFWRDVAQWSQFVIFFGLMAVYLTNVRNLPAYFETNTMKNFVSFLNMMSVSLILATLTSRFIFPLLSLEGRRFWIIGLAPITKRTLMFQKFGMSVATTLFFTMTLIVFSNIMLKVSAEIMLTTCGAMLLMNFALAGLAVGLGAVYPNFEHDNPARIVSGMGGTLNFLLSISYIFVVGLPLFAVTQLKAMRYLDASYPYFMIGSGFFVVAASVTTTWLPMHAGLRHLERMEF
ncbi:hypothetical protein ACFL1X_00330 [Candidatus Hydrogenedentota bacterium]